MKAAVLGDHGVELRDVEKPAPKPNEVLIRVRASTLNRADLAYSICRILGVRAKETAQ